MSGDQALAAVGLSPFLSLLLKCIPSHTDSHKFINSLEQLILHTGHVKHTGAVGISLVSLHQLKASKIKTLSWEDVKCVSFLHFVHIFLFTIQCFGTIKNQPTFLFFFLNIFWDIMYLNMLNILSTINKIYSSVLMYAHTLTSVTTYSSFRPNLWCISFQKQHFSTTQYYCFVVPYCKLHGY